MGWSITIGNKEWNYTHNVNPMIRDAGIPDWPYGFLDNLQAKGEAYDMVKPLTLVISNLNKSPNKYRAMNPSNGWGNYDGVIMILAQMLNHCASNPKDPISHWS